MQRPSRSSAVAAAPLRTLARDPGSIPTAYVLGALIVLQWIATAVVVSGATHNGWLFYNGGDGTYYWTTTWSLAHDHVPQTVISYGLPVFLWPLGLAFGANILAGLPSVVILQVLLLAPLGVLAMYGLAARIGGRRFGYAATLAWILAPAALLWIVGQDGFETKLQDLVFPNALGVTNLGDYASMILALTATFLVVRALDDRRWDDVILAGLTTGLLLAVKPSNAFYLPAPLLAFAVCRRWREGLAFAALLVPTLITLTIWKKLGLGYVPVASPPTRTLALVGGIVPSPDSFDQYMLFDWPTLKENYRELNEGLRGVQALLLVLVVGLVALIRRAPIPGILIGAWCLTFTLLKGGAESRASVQSTSALRLVMPAYPALIVLFMAGAFAIVTGALYRTWGPRRVRVQQRAVAPTRVALVAAAVLAAYPFLIVVTAQAWGPGHVVLDGLANTQVPVSTDLRATATVDGGRVRLEWDRPYQGSSRVYFIVLRARSETDCVEHTSGSRDCVLSGTTAAGYTADTTFVDRLRPGTSTYRVGLLAGYSGELGFSDMLLISPPVQVFAGAAGSSGG